ncbi:hypothetical protein [Lysobacter sp. CFH 32150]|uniref:hypothetical protein n=1 Tax=Lysobacter sp. CFH 32150 TaxID=2927128 RepID=UPI001FA7A28D|nr:hypothetical protein [Lysobacter sp. CFH 32150]MCI4569445.1 hypothetical protein [Lysobacter sp. CFH 32150]
MILKAPGRSRARWLVLLSLASAPAWAAVQSDAASRQSEASLAASIDVPAAVAAALSEGGKFVVASVAASGETVAVTVSAVGVGASFVVYIAAETVRELGIAAGTAISVTAVASGWLLSAAGEVLCFIANESARVHVHSRQVTP